MDAIASRKSLALTVPAYSGGRGRRRV